ncbi:hypothetical protein, partial [Enterobacter asburiae]
FYYFFGINIGVFFCVCVFFLIYRHLCVVGLGVVGLPTLSSTNAGGCVLVGCGHLGLIGVCLWFVFIVVGVLVSCGVDLFVFFVGYEGARPGPLQLAKADA